jgi:predicted transcriptional regulator
VRSKRAILDVLFPIVRAKLLRALLAAPLKQRYVRELMNLSGLALHTVQDELRKLSAVGLVTSWSNGYHRFYRANRDHPLFAPLRRIVEISAELPGTKHSALHRPRRLGSTKQARRLRRQPVVEKRP